MENQDNPSNIFVELINIQLNKEEKQDIWKNSIYKNIVKLTSNNSGLCGETFIQQLCNKSGIEADIDGCKNKKKSGDGHIKNKTVEIKTAYQGSITNSFQHELGENAWNANYMIFIDISPSCIYLTIFANFTEEFYKSGNKCEPYFPSKRITWRKKSGAFKLDTTVSINDTNIAKGYTIKITENTPITEIKQYINERIIDTAAATAAQNSVITNIII